MHNIMQYGHCAQFPSSIKNKTVYFVKRAAEVVKKDNFNRLVMYGEMSMLPLDQLTATVDTVSARLYCGMAS